MKLGTHCMALCALGLWAAGTVHAQDVQEGCPALPAGSGLAWEYRNMDDADFCRALREDGSEAFGMYIAQDPAFEPKRSNRAEKTMIDGRKVIWYQSELAGQPDIIARETLVEIDRNRSAHIWVQTDSEAQLQEAYRQASGLQFSPRRLSSH